MFTNSYKDSCYRCSKINNEERVVHAFSRKMYLSVLCVSKGLKIFCVSFIRAEGRELRAVEEGGNDGDPRLLGCSLGSLISL